MFVGSQFSVSKRDISALNAVFVAGHETSYTSLLLSLRILELLNFASSRLPSLNHIPDLFSVGGELVIHFYLVGLMFSLLNFVRSGDF